jgi:glycosyltransferase involved in cell wall biosynthesis
MNVAIDSGQETHAGFSTSGSIKIDTDTKSPALQNNPAMNPRVLLVAASPRYVGGQSVMAQRLVQDLRDDNVPIDFLPVDPLLPRFLQPFGRIKYVRTVIRSLFYVGSLIRHVPGHDLVHVFSASYTSFLISPGPAIVIGRLCSKSVVLNYHSGEAEDHLRRSGRITKWLLGLADCIVVPSDYLVSVFAAFGFDAVAIANHVDVTAIPFRERSCLHPRIIVARTLDNLYNIPCALKAFRLLQEKHPQSELIILGDGPQRKRLEELARKLDLANVSFRGTVCRAEIPRLYREADVFLNTSSIDNMPVSIIEAFSAGLPIVTTDAGGIPYMITDRGNGHMVKVDDHVAISERLLELMDCPAEVRRLSRAGREEVAKYRWDVVGPQWIELYRRFHQTFRDARPSKQKQWQHIA